MEDRKGSATTNQVRKLDSFVRKLSDEEIKMFLVVLGALMRQVPAPRLAVKSYLREVEVRLRNNGADFLAKSRSFPTFGLKLLGRDRDGFPISGFKKQPGKIYPALFAWYWAELERLSKVSRPSKSDVLRAQRVLCVLSFAKMIKASSINQIKKSLTEFETRVTSPDSPTKDLKSRDVDGGLGRDDKKDLSCDFAKSSVCDSDIDLGVWSVNSGSASPRDITDSPVDGVTPSHGSAELLTQHSPSLMETLNVNVELDKLPQYVDLDSVSTKPSSLREQPAFPNWFKTQFWGGIRREVERLRGEDPSEPSFGYKDPPYGRVHVLTESAGKLRLIVPYNTPFVHSTGLFSRCRAILSETQGDCCLDQSVGHRFVKRGTTFRDNKMNISCDLNCFSDNISPEAITFGLRSLGLEELDSFLFNLPISLPNGKLITPIKLLMGLKGCFEFSSVMHHYFVRLGGITSYALCGDDLYYRGDLATYLKAIEHSGWTLNRSKTVVSPTVAVFCGEMYWFGHRVSPRVPKVSTCFQSNGKLASPTILFSATRDTIVSLNQIYNRRSVARVIGPFIRQIRIRCNFVVFPELPSKLRGLGMKPSRPNRGLLSMLDSKCALKCALMSIGRLKEDTPRYRWFGIPIELMPSGVEFELPDNPALLKRGAVQLDVARDPPGFRKDISALDISHVLEWYYNDIRYEFLAKAPNE